MIIKLSNNHKNNFRVEDIFKYNKQKWINNKITNM